MKKHTFLTVACLLFSSLLYAAPQREYEDWLPRMREIFGDEQPTISDISSVEVRELKYPGQRFQHIAKTDIQGTGKNRKRIWGFWPIEKNFSFQHETSFILLEEITSTDEDLDEGIIKSRFRVQMFNERLMSAKADMLYGGFISSKDILKSLKKLGEDYGTKIELAAKGMIALGVAQLLAPEPVVSKIGAITNLAAGGALKLVSWMAIEKIGGIQDEDGNLILSEKQVHDLFPEFTNVIAKLRKLEGTEVLTTWVPDKGYTQFEINDIPGLSKEDKELIAKSVFRFNPVGVNSVLPKNKKGEDNIWAIDVKQVFGGILTTTGISYNSLDGTIWVKDCGVGTQHYDDEAFLTKQDETDVTTLKTVEGHDNTITFYKEFKDHSFLRTNARPEKGTIVVVTPQKGHPGPRYIKSMETEGKILNHIDKPAGLLTDINFEENSVTLHFVYVQVRMTDAKK